ncbi:MAG: helix-turn-helix domain-containing protein [Burkholderiales bacterium]
MARITNNTLLSEELLDRLGRLGRRLRDARIHRRLRQIDLAQKSGLSRSTIESIERGEATTSLGAYAHVLWVLGLDREIDLLADPGLDREGIALAFSSADKRVRPRGKIDNDF